MSKAKIVGAVTCGALLTTLAASAGEPVTPNEIIKSFEETFDVHPEPRLKSRNCICATGEFMSTSAASALSRSAMFRQVSVPVVARFSATRDKPNSRNSQEMELEFRLPAGSLQHMAMLNTPLFGTSDPVAFGEMIVATKPDPNTGTPDVQRLHEFLAAHPDAFAQSNFVTATDAPFSYASSAYFSIHTFRFIDAEGRTRFVRWRFLPQDGETPMSVSEAGWTAQDALQERFIRRLASSPVRWDMIVYVGEPADTTDNPSIAWPQQRMHVKAGTLTVTQAMPESTAECAKMNFDPLIAADGIAPADDPVLLFRSSTYGRAFSEILAQALEPVHTASGVGQ
jgi:catalase